MAEHGLFEGRGYEFVNVDMGKGEHKRNGKYPTPNQKVPMMVLPDGTQLGESVAICRYVEESLGDSGLVPQSAYIHGGILARLTGGTMSFAYLVAMRPN